MLDNNFDNHEEIEIVDMAEDESNTDDGKTEDRKVSEDEYEEKESEYEDVCFICRRPEQDRKNVQASQPHLCMLRLYAQDDGYSEPV